MSDIKIAITAERKWRQCPLCRGQGLNPVLLHKVCPKCDGERRVPVEQAKPRWKDHLDYDSSIAGRINRDMGAKASQQARGACY